MVTNRQNTNTLPLTPTRAEWRSLVVLVVWCVIVVRLSVSALDFQFYLDAAKRGQGFYYAYTILPIIRLLAELPLWAAWLVWNGLNVIGLYVGARLLKINAVPLLLSFQAFFFLAHGQVTGLLVLGLGLTAWGMTEGKAWAIGWGVVLLTIKPPYGVLVLALAWHYQPAVKVLIRAMVIPCVVLAVSCILYPAWLLTWLAFIRDTPPNPYPNVSLWQHIGPLALLGWGLLLESRWRNPVMVAALLALTLPYFPAYDLLLFMALAGKQWARVTSAVGFGYLVFWQPVLPATALVLVAYVGYEVLRTYPPLPFWHRLIPAK